MSPAEVWVVETIEDHAAGMILGVYGSMQEAEDAIMASWMFKGRKRFNRDESEGSLELSYGEPFSGTCVVATAFDLNAPIQ